MARRIPDDIASQMLLVVPNVDLARVRVHETAARGRLTRWLQRARIEAVTIGRHVVVTGHLNESSPAGHGLLAHELTHVRQIGELGFVRFFASYLRAYLRGRRRGLSHAEAYRANPFEVEAYRLGIVATADHESRLVAMGSKAGGAAGESVA